MTPKCHVGFFFFFGGGGGERKDGVKFSSQVE